MLFNQSALKLLLPFLTLCLFSQSTEALQIFRSGYSKDKRTQPQAYTCLAGGGADEKWGAGWRNLLQASKGGDVLILRVDGRRGDYESWILNDPDQLQFPKVNSVTTLVLESASDADLEETVHAVQKSEMVFFAGGDQTIYVEWLKHSKLLGALHEALEKRHIPFAGTSAGAAILSGLDYVPHYLPGEDSDVLLRSEQALQDPTSPRIFIQPELLTADFAQNTIADTHFSQRDRMGRLVVFMARSMLNFPRLSPEQVKGVGLDPSTAYCYDGAGQGQVYGSGQVYFLRARRPVESFQPFIWRGNNDAIELTTIRSSDGESSFHFRNWSSIKEPEAFLWIDTDVQQRSHLKHQPYKR